MKNVFKIAIITVLFSWSVQATAQHKHQKIGYTNVEDILIEMPESKQVESELKSYKTQLDNQIQAKMKDFQDKYENYQKGASLMSEVIRADKERELRGMQEQIEAFQKDAEQSMQKKQVELLDPVLKRIQKAIDDVAAENGYTYIFNTEAGYGSSIMLYMPKEDDISSLVKKKLNIGVATPSTAPKNNTPVAPR